MQLDDAVSQAAATPAPDTSLSLLNLFLQADIVVKLVMLVLLLASPLLLLGMMVCAGRGRWRNDNDIA